MARTIEYGKLMHRAMRGLIQQVLRDVEAHGLPGMHHFFITFDTRDPQVQMADWLKARYPAEMTVVMQNWFDKLKVTDDGFFITLNFGDQPEPLYIPYDAIRTFVDPSVEFGLRFDSHDSDDDDNDGDDEPPPDRPQTGGPDSAPNGATPNGAAGRGAAQVVQLDRFRK